MCLFSISRIDQCFNVFSKSKAFHGLSFQGKSFIITFCKPCKLFVHLWTLNKTMFRKCPMALTRGLDNSHLEVFPALDFIIGGSPLLNTTHVCVSFFSHSNNTVPDILPPQSSSHCFHIMDNAVNCYRQLKIFLNHWHQPWIKTIKVGFRDPLRFAARVLFCIA